jgi:hypothetical protein
MAARLDGLEDEITRSQAGGQTGKPLYVQVSDRMNLQFGISTSKDSK